MVVAVEAASVVPCSVRVEPERVKVVVLVSVLIEVKVDTCESVKVFVLLSVEVVIEVAV